MRRNPFSIWAALLVTILTLATAVKAETAATTQPARASSDDWGRAVSKLSDAVRGKDLNALASVLERGPIIRTFASETLQPPERLLGATTGSNLLGIHAYTKIPATLASDLADDFKNAIDVSDNVVRDMTPADDSAERRANETAAQWMNQLLQPEKTDSVAVIVLWRKDKSDSFTSSSTRPLFLLVKGQLIDGKYVFRQVIFGDPLDAKK